MQLYQFLDQNLAALRQASPAAAAWIDGSGADLRALEPHILVNQFGLMDLPLPEGGSLFGKVPPEVFYRKWEAGDKAATSASILVGVNLGYGLNHLLRSTPMSHKVLVFEPRVEMLCACLGQTDYAPWIAAGKLHVFPPDAAALPRLVQQLDLQLTHGKVNLHVDTPSQQLGPEYAAFGGAARRAMENFTLEMATLRLRQDVMLGNELGNFRRAFADGGTQPLAGSAAGLCAVILGAGPSLPRFAPALAAASGDALLATSLQALPALRGLGITPHLCMAIDYSEGMRQVYQRLDREWCRNIPLLYSTKVLPDVVASYPGPTIPVWTEGGFGTFAFKDFTPILDAGGNVSVALLRLLAGFGVSRFVLAGQDFSWAMGAASSHAEGHHAAGGAPARPLEAKNVHGQTVHTAMPYVSGLRDMEKDIARLGLPVHVLYGDGLPIAGAQAATPEQLAEQGLFAAAPGAWARFTAALAQARAPRSRPMFEGRAGQWTSSLRHVTKRLEKLFERLEQKQSEIHHAFDQVVAFLRHDLLYAPYLYNEIMDAAGLAKARARHTRPDLAEFKRIAKRALAKVREVDSVLAAPAKAGRRRAA